MGDEQPQSTRDGASRRDFLKVGGAAAAGLAAGGIAGVMAGREWGHEESRPVAPDPVTAPGFAHVVVLMGENRSFDNLLGYLYDADTLPEGQTFEGLNFGDYSNVAPDGRVIPAHPYTGTTDQIMASPNPDPGEPYPHVNTQLFGVVKPPHNVPADDSRPTMEGFITDYAINWTQVKKSSIPPTSDELSQVMGAFTPEMLPVLSTLAREFAVYDHWFAGVPSQTFCGHFATMTQFYIDVENGELQPYSFIEPRMAYNHNDFHPAFGEFRASDVDGSEVVDSAISDVRAGELLVHNVYTAIRGSDRGDGSNALNTLLLITFDEHGGTYDHVPPPRAQAPDASRPGEMGFGFERLGCRVPAIAVSAWTRSGTVIRDEMHHGSVIATLTRLHGLEPLTRRDEEATPLFNAVNLEVPRDPTTWPTTTPQYLPPNPQADDPHPGNAHKDKPLSPPAEGLLGLLLARYGNPDGMDPKTYGDAYTILKKYGIGLFGEGGDEDQGIPLPSPTP